MGRRTGTPRRGERSGPVGDELDRAWTQFDTLAKSARTREGASNSTISAPEKRTRARDMSQSATPHTRGKKACKHTATSGSWLSYAHVTKCLGVDAHDLVLAVWNGTVRCRPVGRRDQYAQVNAADLRTVFELTPC